MKRRVLICGCGYVGLELGRQLAAEGHAVYGLRRTTLADAGLRAAGITPLTGDLTQLDDLRRLPGPFEWVVNTVSSTRGGADEYRNVYLGGTRSLVAWLDQGIATRLVYTSSTSVYGQTDDSWVDEASPTHPAAETARVLVETEAELLRAVRDTAIEAVILRVAGIYGPGRGHLFQQFLRGEAHLQGDGSRRLNMIHRDDVASAVRAALERGVAGSVYNATDDEPVSRLEFLRWIGTQLNRPLPPTTTCVGHPERKRGLTLKRVSNRRLRIELAWSPQFPTFREGYAAAVESARAAPVSQPTRNEIR